MKEKRQLKQDLILVLICILILMIGLGSFFIVRTLKDQSIPCEMKVSENQKDIVLPTDKKNDEEEYTELMGFGRLDLSENEPFIYLINPSDNQVYLSFDVIYNGEILYQSDLIAPGKMEEFNVCSCLNAGEHTLTYSISSYDMNNKNILWSGVQQNQDILIRK
ncbi:MAG: hypothetical protein IKS54_06250 [Erysipelotrichaceae bacterium]|nr:hypothetical protein [Erysipelotrichaceae bacterium]